MTDDEPPRELFWRPCLKHLGIRYRSPYETRHTYATTMLMQGVAPAFAARQLGHSVEMFLRTFTRWIERRTERSGDGQVIGPFLPGTSPA